MYFVNVLDSIKIKILFKLWFFKGNLKKIKYNECEWFIFCNVIKVIKSNNF